MSQNPLMLLLLIGTGCVILWLWIRDFRSRAAPVHPHPFPGATSSPASLVWVGAVLGLVLVAAESTGESILGISDEQSVLTPMFAVWTLIAAPTEEIVFRGFLVVQNRGRTVLWFSIVGFSAAFALIHPFLWTWGSEGFELSLTTKGWFSTVFAFGGSLLFYSLRFNHRNKECSLLPCFAAHLAKNVGVIAIKAAQGFIAWS